MAEIDLIKISELPATSTIGDADELAVVQGGATKKVPYSVLKAGAEVTPDTTLSEAGVPADAAAVGAALAQKANQAAVTQALAAKVDKSEVTDISGDIAELASVVETKADQTALNQKADKTTTDALRQDLTTLNGIVNQKADKTELNTQIGNVTAELATKANTADVNNLLAAKANVASPVFTGRPQAPTAAKGTATLQLATTAFVQNAIDDKEDKLTFDQAPTQGSTNPVTSGGVWDTTTGLKNELNEIAELTEGKNLFDKTKVLDNKYCNVSGVISDYNGRYVTDYIPVTPGKIVTSSYYNGTTGVQTAYGYSSICCYDRNKEVVTGGNINQSTFTVPSGVYFVRITYASSMITYSGMVELTDDGQFTVYEPYTDEKSYTLTENVNVPLNRVTGLENRLANDEDNIAALETSVNGALDTGILFTFSGFIRYDGALIDNASYVSTDYVDILSGGTFVPYRYRLQMFANTKIAYYNESKVFISAISPSESGTLEYVEGIVPYVDGARYVRFSTAKNSVGYYVKYASVKNAVINGATDMNPCNYSGNEMSVFNKVLCIGDSLTSGTFNYRVGGTTSNYIEYAKYSYPTYLKKLTGCETANMGNGGMSSAEWYNAHMNDDLSGYDCAILQLGVNDRIRYTTWGETSETAFTNIINKLKAENKNIKIFVANIIPATSYSDAQYLAFSADLLAWVQTTYASDANVIPLDMQQYGHTKDSPAYNCGHLSALGYRRLAQDYKGYIGWYINQNKTVFKEVQFIGTDYYYAPI